MHGTKIITMLATCSCAGRVSCMGEGPILNSVQSRIMTLNIFGNAQRPNWSGYARLMLDPVPCLSNLITPSHEVTHIHITLPVPYGILVMIGNFKTHHHHLQ